MHIPDGLIPFNQAAIYWFISLIFISLFFIRVSKKVDLSKRLVLTSLLTAATVIVNSLSIPSPFGIPMHFFLVPLIVIILGPLNGILVVFLALLAQSLFLGVGGITTLGANILVMGISLGLVSYYVYKLFLDINQNIAIFVSTILGILTATIVQIIILLLTGTTSLNVLLASLLPFYLVVAIIEGFANIIIIKFITKVRGDILGIEKI